MSEITVMHFDNLSDAERWADLLNTIDGLNDDSHPCCIQIKKQVLNLLYNFGNNDIGGQNTSRLNNRRHPILGPNDKAPLGVVADKKGMYVCEIVRYEYLWQIGLGCPTEVDPRCFEAPTYPECEAKARAFLMGLPDREGN